MPYFNKYIGEKGVEGLFNYKYAARDDSLVYKHITNRWFLFCMNFCPEWMAPNLITLLGFCFTIGGHFYVMSYATDATAPIESNVLWTYAFCVFVYATMDAMDGKQARKTGSSSPLGLMFDHGCDCIQTTLLCMVMTNMFQVGYTWKMGVMWSFGAVGFFFATLEEYFTGMMYLPIINGATEGVLVTIGLIVGTGFQDMDDPFWLQPALISSLHPSLANCVRHDDMLIALCILTGPTVLGNLFNIGSTIQEKKEANKTKTKEEQEAPQRYRVRIAFTRISMFFMTFAVYFFWAFGTNSTIFTRHGRMLMYTLGCVHSKMLMGLMIAHLTDMEYFPFTKTMAAVMALGSLMLLCNLDNDYSFRTMTGAKYDQATLDNVEDLALASAFVIAFGALIHMIVNVIYEMSSILGIMVFRLPSKKKNA